MLNTNNIQEIFQKGKRRGQTIAKSKTTYPRTVNGYFDWFSGWRDLKGLNSLHEWIV